MSLFDNQAIITDMSDDETLYPNMAVPRELAEQLVECYPDAQNYPEALRQAGWCVVDAKKKKNCGEG